MTGTVLSCSALLLTIGEGELLITDLAIERGKLYRVFGAASSGASDFLQLIAGLDVVLESSRPATASRVMREPIVIDKLQLRPLVLGDQPLFDVAAKRRARQIGFIWEDPETSFLGSKVREEYWYQPAALGIAPLPSLWGLRDYGLYEKRDQDIFTLSGGEKHRLNVASVLALERDLIVADFGSSNLDDDFEVELLKRLRDEMDRGAAVVIRGLEDHVPLGDTTWIGVDGGVVSVLGADPPAGFVAMQEQRRLLSAALEARTRGDVVLVLDSARPAFAPGNLTCELHEGEILVVRGRNGIGKTSLGRAVVDARIQLSGGRRTLAPNTRPMMSLQSVAHTFVRRSVLAELSGDERLIAACGLTERADEHPLALNTSDQKLVAVAAALKHAQRVAMIDEPTCGMDFGAKRRFVSLLNLFPSLAIAILTHDAALEGLGTVVEMR